MRASAAMSALLLRPTSAPAVYLCCCYKIPWPSTRGPGSKSAAHLVQTAECRSEVRLTCDSGWFYCHTEARVVSGRPRLEPLASTGRT